jgi:aspartate kinase
MNSPEEAHNEYSTEQAERVVCKFGGTSLADAVQIRKVAAIVQSDARRRFVVVSAPGKRNSSDQKITDLLLTCWHLALKSWITASHCA